MDIPICRASTEREIEIAIYSAAYVERFASLMRPTDPRDRSRAVQDAACLAIDWATNVVLAHRKAVETMERG